MLELHTLSPRTPQEKERVARENESTDRGIDRLVYELYGLTVEEIKFRNRNCSAQGEGGTLNGATPL